MAQHNMKQILLLHAILISGGIMLPVTGYLVQLMGKKLLMFYSIWLFCIGCLLCILAPNLQALIAAV